MNSIASDSLQHKTDSSVNEKMSSAICDSLQAITNSLVTVCEIK